MAPCRPTSRSHVDRTDLPSQGSMPHIPQKRVPLIRAKQKRAERRRDARVSSRADGSTARRPRSQPRERDTLGRRGVLSPTWPCGIVSGRCRMRTWRSCAVSPRRSTPVISTGTTASSLIHWSNGRRRGKIQTPQPITGRLVPGDQLHHPRRQGCARRGVLRPRRSPRSRWPVRARRSRRLLTLFAGSCLARDAEATRALRPECLPAYAPKWTLFEPAGSGDD